jgi:hypothetical protein
MIKKLAILISLFLIASFLSCRKDSPVISSVQQQSDTAVSQPSETIYDYFIKYNAEFVNDYMPQYSGVYTGCPEIITVKGNTYAIPGGPNKLTVDFADVDHDVSEVYYGVKGVFGYYKLSIPAGTIDKFDLVVIISQLIQKSTFILQVSIKDLKGNISHPYLIPVILKSADPGKLQITLSFDQPNDLDLHLVEPDTNEIYFGNPISASGGYLDLDANAGCQIDSVNIENIIYNDSVQIPLGAYRVYVRYFSQCIFGVTTNFSVTALYGGELIAPSSGTNPFMGSFQTYTGNDQIDAMTFEMGGSIAKVAQFVFVPKKFVTKVPSKIKDKRLQQY